MKTIQSKTIVFITGAFVTHLGWEPWKAFFESKGYTTLAPPWPFKEESPVELRARHPDGNPGLANLTLDEVVDHYAAIVRDQPEKPIVIGHSLGGLIAQIIVNREPVAAGVAIHPVSPQGIIPYEFSFLKASFKALGLFTDQSETYLMSFEDWQYAFVNEMTLEEQQAAYEANTIPESKSVTRGGLTSAAHIDFEKPHPPLLITSGSLDHIIPAHLNKRNFEAYAQNGSVLRYKEFEGRNHFVLGQPTWPEDAEYILDWLENH